MRYSDADAPAYRTTAETLRVAYWDWAQTPVLPEALTLETVTVKSPNGSITMRNPLHSYHFHTFPFSSAYMRHGVFSAQNHTTRCPTANTAENATAVNSGLATANLKAQVVRAKHFDDPAGNTARFHANNSRQYEVFTTAETFQEMETDYYSKPSFESPHNNVHNAVGCPNGTMYDLNWSAFDPIFMLHHANVDRLIALWQAIYYNSSMYTIEDYEGALFGTAAGAVGGLTPLKPFYDGNGDFHTSESVKNISAFGYTYPELQPATPGGQKASLSPDELSSYVKFRVNALYTDNSTAVPYGGGQVRRYRGPRTAWGKTDGAILGKTWSVSIQVDKGQVTLPATVNCYLGTSLVGMMALLGIPATGVTHSTIPLDKALAMSLADLGDDEGVISFLASLLWFDMQKVSPIPSRSAPNQAQGVRQLVVWCRCVPLSANAPRSM